MSTNKRNKLNRLLSAHPGGVVFTTNWLKQQGYSLELQKRYKSSRWLEAMGRGALKRFGEDVGYEGAVYALQKQLRLSVHPGGRTALSLLGKAHYLEMSPKTITLFGSQNERLPSWFRHHDWGKKIDYHARKLLPHHDGLVEFETNLFTIKISDPCRAMMECLFLVNEKQGLLECNELMEGLNNLRPQQVQKLLNCCSSVKVKRLFLFLAEKAQHSWFKYLDLNTIDLGKGKRSVVREGTLDKKYQITIPKELASHGNEYHGDVEQSKQDERRAMS